MVSHPKRSESGQLYALVATRDPDWSILAMITCDLRNVQHTSKGNARTWMMFTLGFWARKEHKDVYQMFLSWNQEPLKLPQSIHFASVVISFI